jgi:hypothetical protein
MDPATLLTISNLLMVKLKMEEADGTSTSDPLVRIYYDRHAFAGRRLGIHKQYQFICNALTDLGVPVDEIHFQSSVMERLDDALECVGCFPHEDRESTNPMRCPVRRSKLKEQNLAYCRGCRGRGEIVRDTDHPRTTDQCPDCKGKGSVPQETKISDE